MNMEQAQQLTRIYNTFLLVKTSGEDTILMGKCMEALKAFLAEVKIETSIKENNIE